MGVTTFLYNLCAVIIDFCFTITAGILSLFISVMDVSLEEIVAVFPAVSTMNSIIISLAIGIYIIAILWQGYTLMFKPIGADTEGLPKILMKALIFGALLFMAQYFSDALFNIGKNIYYMFMEADGGIVSGIIDDVANLFNNNTTAVGGVAVLDGAAALVVCFFLFFMIGYNIVCYMVEIFERYMTIAVLNFLSPLAFACGAGGKTLSKVFTSWLSMYASGVLLIALNGWSMSIILSGLQSATAYSTSTGSSLIVWAMLNLGCVKTMQKLDEMMSKLGLATAKTGSGLLAEAIGSGKTMMAIKGKIGL